MIEFEDEKILNISLIGNHNLDQATKAKVKETLESVKIESKPFNLKRGTEKRRITLAFKKLNDWQLNDELTDQRIFSKLESINGSLKQIKVINDNVISLYQNKGLFSIDEVYFDSEIEIQESYLDNINDQISKFKNLISTNDDLNDITNQSPNNDMAYRMLQPSNKLDLPTPILHCSVFSGEKGEDFSAFWHLFENTIGNRKNISDSAKLIYLKSYLSKYALLVVEHLSNVEANYPIACQLLKDEFLDIDHICQTLFEQILVKPDSEIYKSNEKLQIYLCSLRSRVYELKNYGFDFFEQGTPGNLLLSYILFKDLPNYFKKCLIGKTTPYPTLNDLFNNFITIIRTMTITSNNKNFRDNNQLAKPRFNQRFLNKTKQSNVFPSKVSVASPSSLQNFKTFDRQSQLDTNSDKHNNNVIPKPCILCNRLHFLHKCTEYPDIISKRKRCVELGLCSKCIRPLSLDMHLGGQCPGVKYACYKCKSLAHLTVLCDKLDTVQTRSNLCINMNAVSQCQFILPVVPIVVYVNNKPYQINCLIDTGSQKSYIDKQFLIDRNFKFDNREPYEFNIETFIGSQKRNILEVMLDIKLNPKAKFKLPILVDQDLKLNYKISGLQDAFINLRNAGYRTACNNIISDGFTDMHCILGVDLIYHIPFMNKIRCMEGQALETPYGIVPIGTVKDFLTPQQVQYYFYNNRLNKPNKNEINTNLTIAGKNHHNSTQINTIVNNILQPVPTYQDPLIHTHSDRNMDIGLEYLYNFESIGIKLNNDVDTFDQLKIDEFKKEIEFVNGKYYVALPWAKDVKGLVPSNHEVALRVLDRVCKDLTNKGLTNQYNEIFQDQLNNGIIEQFFATPDEYKNYKFVCHRPIIKTSSTVSTKIRVVYNCSFRKTGEFSLNQCAYPGIDLLSSLFKLLINFRANKYVLLMDITKAFLSIKLKYESDRNFICFFWRHNGELKMYRFLSTPFGLSSSPFCLNYVIKHHLKNYDNDLTNHILNQYFYVDNLITTFNNPDVVIDVYNKAVQRMREGGFELKQGYTNLSSLELLMVRDNNYVSHVEEFQKVLGYTYYGASDEITISDFELDICANTKRRILSQLSKQFDPLGLVNPLICKGKILMRELWRENYSWDKIIPQDKIKQWQDICVNLTDVQTIRFPRIATLNEEVDYVNKPNLRLSIFCDSSTNVYGFCVYTHTNNDTNLLMSKIKIAPINRPSVPVLEALAVYIALLCLPNLLDAYDDKYNITCVNIFSDSQVTINWILGTEVKNHKLFIRNRIRDIQLSIKNLKVKYNTHCNVYYVSTQDNSADLLTRGITFNEFKNKLQFWLHGPEWLSKSQDYWPRYALDSVSETTKSKISNYLFVTILNNSTYAINPPFDITRFSDYTKVINITTNLYKFRFMTNKEINLSDLATKFWIKFIQFQSLCSEIEFLNNPSNKNVPRIVQDLNLFLDKEGIIRCKGRINRTNYFNYEVINPILLPKSHYYTKLYIMYAHNSVQHLGINSTLQIIRLKGYWIVGARQIIKRTLADCMICKKYNARSYLYPKLTDITMSAVKMVRIFNFVGIDFTGHIYLKDEADNIHKYYILIYVCMSIRAVILDLLPSMSTQHVLLSFKRFCNVYGMPTRIYSDNYSSFIHAGGILGCALTSTPFTDFLDKCQIKHIRVSVNAPFQATYWERQLRTVKNCLYKAIGRSRLSYFQMLTQLSTIQHVINSRPLTYRSMEKEFIPISPNSFLKMHCNKELIFKEQLGDITLPDKNEINESLKVMHEIYDHFRINWMNEYLLSLRETHRDLFQIDWSNRVKIGEIVLIKSDQKPRPFWNMGVVTELFYGEQNVVRNVKVRRSDGVTAQYPINRLFPLEVNIVHNSKVSTSSEVDNSLNNNDPPQIVEDTNFNPGEDSPINPNESGSDSITDVEGIVQPDSMPSKEQRLPRRAAIKFKQFMKDNIDYM